LLYLYGGEGVDGAGAFVGGGGGVQAEAHRVVVGLFCGAVGHVNLTESFGGISFHLFI